MRLFIAVTKTYEYQVDDAWREDLPELKELIRRCHDQAPINELVRNKIPDERHQFIECCLTELDITTEPEG